MCSQHWAIISSPTGHLEGPVDGSLGPAEYEFPERPWLLVRVRRRAAVSVARQGQGDGHAVTLLSMANQLLLVGHQVDCQLADVAAPDGLPNSRLEGGPDLRALDMIKENILHFPWPGSVAARTCIQP